jgi:hypothetical protein
MVDYTRTELATRVLRDLGMVAADETPTAVDLAWALETCDSEIEQMEARGIAIWNGGVNSVPRHYLTLLSRRIGISIAPSFGLSDIGTAQTAMAAMEQELRRLGTVPATGQPMTAEYF